MQCVDSLYKQRKTMQCTADCTTPAKSSWIRLDHSRTDILDIPQPPSEVQVTVEGCPVVHLPDNSEEFALFIGFIYDAWECVTLYIVIYAFADYAKLPCG